ncbi:MAG: hypothetical protein LBO73_01310 [Holosporaceae bacterium]|jgi:hypothetical protein|nr:hypothetical protein [Holosporaceae bacterium]
MKHTDTDPDVNREHSGDPCEKQMTIDESVEKGKQINTYLHDVFKKLFKRFLTGACREKYLPEDLAVIEEAVKMGISLYSEAIEEYRKSLRNEETEWACMIMKIRLSNHLKSITAHFLSGLRRRLSNKPTGEKQYRIEWVARLHNIDMNEDESLNRKGDR